MIEPGSGSIESQPPPRREADPWTVAGVTLIVTLISFSFIGPFIGLAAAYPFYDGKPMDYISDIVNPVGVSLPSRTEPG